MKKITIKGLILLLAGALVIPFSCVKKDNFFGPGAGSTEQTIVKLVGGGTPAKIIKDPIDFVNAPKTLLVADIRRDPATSADLNSTMTVVIKDDTAAVRAANPAYLFFPAAWYTIQSEAPKVGGSGGTFTFVFKPGEVAKQIYITIPNATLLDPSSLYGLGFTITSVDGGGAIDLSSGNNATNPDGKSVIIEIGAKNAYDGVYHVTGTLSDVSEAYGVAGAHLFGPWTPYWEADLVTTGANTVDVYDETYTGIVAHPFFNAGASTYYGAFGLMLAFDPATGNITDLHNYYGDPTKPSNPGGNPGAGTGPPLYAASNTRRAVIDPSYTNKFNSSNHSIDIQYWLVQPSVMGSNIPRTYFTEHWEYIGPR